MLPEPEFYALVYRESDYWVARSPATGHVSIGSLAERALRCLVGTVAASIQLAHERGLSFKEWLDSQAPDEPAYVMMYARVARERGVRQVKLDQYTVTTAQAA